MVKDILKELFRIEARDVSISFRTDKIREIRIDGYITLWNNECGFDRQFNKGVYLLTDIEFDNISNLLDFLKSDHPEIIMEYEMIDKEKT